MKKLFALLLAMMTLFCGAALAEDFTGEWYAQLMSVPFTMTLSENGVYTMDLMGDSDEGTWEVTADGLLLDKGTEEAVTLIYDAEAVTLSVTLEGMELVFSREPIPTFTPAAVRSDAALEEFAGAWKASKIDVVGIMMDPTVAGINMEISIEGVSVTLTFSMTDTQSFTLDGTFENGALTISGGEAGGYTITLLEDGMMAVNFAIMDQTMNAYLDRVV